MEIDNTFEDRTAVLETTDAHLHSTIGDIDNYSRKLDDVLTMIANALKVLIKERDIQLSNLSEHHGDFVGSLATLMTRVDELENTTSGMAVMKLQDSIDELEADIAEIDRRLDDASITI